MKLRSRLVIGLGSLCVSSLPITYLVSSGTSEGTTFEMDNVQNMSENYDNFESKINDEASEVQNANDKAITDNLHEFSFLKSYSHLNKTPMPKSALDPNYVDWYIDTFEIASQNEISTEWVQNDPNGFIQLTIPAGVSSEIINFAIKLVHEHNNNLIEEARLGRSFSTVRHHGRKGWLGIFYYTSWDMHLSLSTVKAIEGAVAIGVMALSSLIAVATIWCPPLAAASLTVALWIVREFAQMSWYANSNGVLIKFNNVSTPWKASTYFLTNYFNPSWGRV